MRKRPILFAVIAAIAFSLPPSVAKSQTVPEPAAEEMTEGAAQDVSVFSLYDALLISFENNPSLRAARAELLAVHERLPQAFAGWKPTVTGEAGLTVTDIEGSNFGNADGSTEKDYLLSVSQPLFRGGSTFAEVASARNVIASQTYVLRAREQDVMLDAVTAYMDVLRDEALLQLARNNRDVISRELEATRDRFDVGELTKTDVSQAEARQANADANIVRALGNLNSSRAIFEKVVGTVPGNLKPPQMISSLLPDTLEAAVLQSEAQNPRVLSAINAHRASEDDVDDVFGELLPAVGVFGSWNKTYDPSPGLSDEQTAKAIGISATIPLYEAGSVRSRVRQAKHTANQRYLEILEARRQVRQEAISNWENLQASEAEIRSRQAQVKAASVAQEGVRAEAEFGSRTVLDTLDADQELLDARVALVTAQRNEIVAQFALLSTIGLLRPETLGIETRRYDYDRNLKEVSGKIFDLHVDRVEKSE